ncbi:RDD family protein [Microbacterium koreense]|uniref:RDD family protein n=1 Tax=Microbacterium koreense TaxID=323761 RepID=A0ABW2ZQD4_9MICO
MTPAAAAPVARRAIAYVIDAVIAAALGVVLTIGLVIAVAVAGPDAAMPVLLIGAPIVMLFLLGWFVVYTAMQSGRGSIGMRAQGVVLTASDGTPLGFGRALVRNVVFGLAASIVVGYFTPLFDGSGRFQGWHDKAVGSLVRDARHTADVPAAGDSPAPAAAEPSAGAVQGPGAPLAPAVAAPPIQPTAVAPDASGAPAASGAPGTPAAPGTPPAPGTSVAPVADAGSLIAFVPGVTQPPPSSVGAPDARDDEARDATVVGRPAPTPASTPTPTPAPYSPKEPEPEPEPPASVVEPSPEGEDTEDTRISIPGHRLVFTWDDGTRATVSGRTLFGRNPAAEEAVTVVAVRDETLSLSKTHFEAAADASGGWVLDRHSTNGMTLIRDGRRLACPAGQRVPVRLGDALEIGDRIVTIGGYA